MKGMSVGSGYQWGRTAMRQDGRGGQSATSRVVPEGGTFRSHALAKLARHAGGARYNMTHQGDYIVAFALPKR